jgi:hypothetical protein
MAAVGLRAFFLLALAGAKTTFGGRPFFFPMAMAATVVGEILSLLIVTSESLLSLLLDKLEETLLALEASLDTLELRVALLGLAAVVFLAADFAAETTGAMEARRPF